MSQMVLRFFPLSSPPRTSLTAYHPQYCACHSTNCTRVPSHNPNPNPIPFFSLPRTSLFGSTPSILLNSGGTAFYTKGNGTSTLEFLYTVGEGESSSDLDVAVVASDVTATVAISLSVNGSIFDENVGSRAVVTLPKAGVEGNWGDQANIIIDTE